MNYLQPIISLGIRRHSICSFILASIIGTVANFITGPTASAAIGQLLNCDNLPAGWASSANFVVPNPRGGRIGLVVEVVSDADGGRCQRGSVLYSLQDNNGDEVVKCVAVSCGKNAKICKTVEPGSFPKYKCATPPVRH